MAFKYDGAFISNIFKESIAVNGVQKAYFVPEDWGPVEKNQLLI